MKCFPHLVSAGNLSSEERITRGVAGMNDQSNEYHEHDKRQEEGEDDVQGPENYENYFVGCNVGEPCITSLIICLLAALHQIPPLLT